METSTKTTPNWCVDYYDGPKEHYCLPTGCKKCCLECTDICFERRRCSYDGRPWVWDPTNEWIDMGYVSSDRFITREESETIEYNYIGLRKRPRMEFLSEDREYTLGSVVRTFYKTESPGIVNVVVYCWDGLQRKYVIHREV